MAATGLAKIIQISPELRTKWGVAYRRLKKRLEITE